MRFRMMLIGLLLFLFQSCGLWRKTEKEKPGQFSVSDSLSNNLLNANISADEKRVVWYADSAGSSYRVEIIPKGIFRFSADSGFRGEAEHLLWQGKTFTGHAVLNHSESSHQEQLSSTQHTRQQQKQEIKTQSTQRQPGHPAILILAFVLIGLILLYALYRSLVK